jgi:transposase
MRGATATTVEVSHRAVRVSSHTRSHVPHKATTVNEHRPKAHQRHLQWTPSRLVDWAQTVGPATAGLFDRIMESKCHPEQGYRSCLGVLRLAKQYTGPRVEADGRSTIRTFPRGLASLAEVVSTCVLRDYGGVANPTVSHSSRIRRPYSSL